MNVTNTALSLFPDTSHPDLMGAGDSYRSAQYRRLTVSQEQNADISILTEEGDKITLSLATEFHAGFVTYSSSGRTRSGAFEVQAESLMVDMSQGLQIRVEGDLSEEEISDIQKTLQEIAKIMQDVLSGDLDKAAAGAAKVAGYDTISSVAADLSYEQHTILEQRSITESQSQTRGPAESDSKHENAEGSREQRIDGLTDLMMARVGRAKTGKRKFLGPARRLLSQMLRRTTHEGHASHGQELAEKVKSSFLKKLQEAADREEPVDRVAGTDQETPS